MEGAYTISLVPTMKPPPIHVAAGWRNAHGEKPDQRTKQHHWKMTCYLLPCKSGDSAARRQPSLVWNAGSCLLFPYVNNKNSILHTCHIPLKEQRVTRLPLGQMFQTDGYVCLDVFNVAVTQKISTIYWPHWQHREFMVSKQSRALTNT